MKAEHRKELMTNTLANRIGEAIQGMKEGPSRGTILVLVAVGLILILILVWHYFSTSATESDSARWLKWYSLSSPEQLRSFVEDKDVQDHIQGRLARMEEARRGLHDGLRDLGGVGTRTQALENIKRAAELYAKLVGDCSDKPLLHQQALMGAAKAHESLGEYGKARDYYQQLAQNYPNTVLGSEAGDQLQRLNAGEQNGELKALRDEYKATASAP
jgi:hypothetical protein